MPRRSRLQRFSTHCQPETKQPSHRARIRFAQFRSRGLTMLIIGIRAHYRRLFT